jgi:hypothetical protein
MPQQRVKGQEVSVLIVRDSVLEDTLTNIQDAEVTISSEIITKGYLGEKTNRTDDIYNGVKGKLTLHLHDQAYLNYVLGVLARQKRDTPDVVINITMTLAFPNGQTPSILVPDAKFGEIPLSAGNRADYVQTSLDFAADDFQILFG